MEFGLKELSLHLHTNFLTRRECHVCGGFAQMPILCEAANGMRICESCLETRDFDEQLSSRATELEDMARELRGLVGKIDAPTYEEWKKAERRHDAAVQRLHADNAWSCDEAKDVEHDMNDETKARVWVRPPCPALPDDAGSRGSNETDF